MDRIFRFICDGFIIYCGLGLLLTGYAGGRYPTQGANVRVGGGILLIMGLWLLVTDIRHKKEK
jgi:hypothetical protein